ALTANGRTLVALSQVNKSDGTMCGLHTWDVATGKNLQSQSFQASDFLIAYSRFNSDGRLVVLEDGTVRDSRTGTALMRLSVEGGNLHSPLAISRDGALVAASVMQPVTRPGWGGQEMVAVQVWEFATLLPVQRLETGPLAHLELTPDGRHLLTAGMDGLKLWELATAKQVAYRTGPGTYRGSYGASFASSLALAPDGHTVATGQPDTTVLLW